MGSDFYGERSGIVYNQTLGLLASYNATFFNGWRIARRGLIALVSGLPAGLASILNSSTASLAPAAGLRPRRPHEDRAAIRAHILSGVRHGKTIGSPVAIEIVNRDWKNWTEKLPVEAGDPAKHQAVASPRPGHADLAGALKYNFPDARYVLERASARESTARVAAGGIAKLLLRHWASKSPAMYPRGPRRTGAHASWEEIAAAAERSPRSLLSCVDAATEARMKEEVDQALRTGDTVGGVFEVVVHGAPAGLGTYANWDERLDGLLAWAVMSLQAVKAVEIGRGVTAAESFGSAVHDAIGYSRAETWPAPPALPASRTMPAASRAASPMAKTSSCAAI